MLKPPFVGLGYFDERVSVFLAQAEQREAMEQDDREGLILDYLDTPLPENWRKMELADRIQHLNKHHPGDKIESAEKRKTVSNMEIWVECFRKDKASIQPKDSYELAGVMLRLGWVQSGQREYDRIHGRQRVYFRGK